MKKRYFACLSLLLVAAFTCLSFAACGEDNAESDLEPEKPKSKTTLDWDYRTWEYTNEDGAKATLDYACYVPETYGEEKLPLVMWIPDSGFVNSTIQQVSETSSFPTIWATEDMLEKYPMAVLILTLTPNSLTDNVDKNYLDSLAEETSEESQVVNIIDAMVEEFNLDEERLYLTGQSMGGIFEWSLNTYYPNKFAATVYVGCQPGGQAVESDAQKLLYETVLERAEFLHQKFIYIGSRQDPGNQGGQDDVEAVFIESNVEYVKYYEFDSKTPDENGEYFKETLLDENINNYFLGFPSVNSGMSEHLRSFQPSYKITALLEWLLSQKLEDV